MIALDTNVLVRYITQDDPAQAAEATRVIESHCSPSAPGWVSLVVLCELVWVLARAYGYDKALIIGVLEGLLGAADLRIDHGDVVDVALRMWRTGPADFADYVILAAARDAGAKPLVTLDRRLARHPDAMLAVDVGHGWS